MTLTITKPVNGSKVHNLIPAGAYIRMSSDQQEDSPERQRREIDRLAEREGCGIVEWYSDHGMTGTESKKRSSFQKMLADAKAGKFKAILLAEQSRMSREDPLDAMDHWRKLRDAGVTVYTCQRGRVDFSNIAGLIVTMVDAHAAHDESRKIAERTVTGKRAKLARGDRVMGSRPFGFDREFTNESGKVVAVATSREKFQKPRGWRARLVPARNAKDVEAIRLMFDMFSAGKTLYQITVVLNRSEVRVRSHPWTSDYIEKMLTNPIYVGDTVVLGHKSRSRAKFMTVAQDGDDLIVRDTHEGLVSREQFDRVQSLLAKRPKNSGRRSHKYLLSGLVRCASCKRAAFGTYQNNAAHEPIHRYYRCAGLGQPCPDWFCKDRFTVPARVLERIVIDIIKAAVTTPDSKNAIVAALKRRGKGAPLKAAARLETQRVSLRDQIAKATRNLALADAENVPAINALIAGWRGEATDIEAQLAAITHTVKLAPEAQAAIDKLSAVLDKIELADHDRLRQALSATIKCIYFGRRKSADGCYMITYGWIELQPGLGSAKIDFDVKEKNQCAHWPRVAAYLRKAFPRIVKSPEIAKALGADVRLTRQHLARAVKKGVAVRNPHGQGWLAKL